MSTERDSTRIVQSWLEAGSTAIPDRVVDAVLAELPSRPQRRSRWSLWRSFRMKPIMPVAVGAAAVLLAIVLGSQFLPSDSGIGGPTSSSVPSPTSQPVGGQVTYSLPFDNVLAVDIDASSDGSSLSGTAVVSDDGETLYTVELQCLRRFDDQTWMLAGAITPEPEGQDLTKWTAVIVRDGSPQLVGIWGLEAATADDCEEFVSEIPDSAVTRPNIGPMLEGGITLPPAPPANLP